MPGTCSGGGGEDTGPILVHVFSGSILAGRCCFLLSVSSQETHQNWGAREPNPGTQRSEGRLGEVSPPLHRFRVNSCSGSFHGSSGV